MPAIRIVTQPISRSALRQAARETFVYMVKAVVDLEKKIMVIGGELHADEEQALLEQGSLQKDLWGINLYPDMDDDQWIEYDSMINIRPAQQNRSRSVEDPDIRQKIVAIVSSLVSE